MESGRRNNRLQLIPALAECKAGRATLVIAKLNRLARNVHFISCLMESRMYFKLDFMTVDMPEAKVRGT